MTPPRTWARTAPAAVDRHLERLTAEQQAARAALLGERGPACPDCGREWSPSCRRATPPSWDPTRGVRSNDPTRHPWSRRYRTGAA